MDRWKKIVMNAPVAFALLSSPAIAAQACQGVDQTLSDSRKQMYAGLAAKSVRIKVDPARIAVTRFMESGPWSLAWVEMPEAEPGVFFFEKSANGMRSDEIWGGWAVPSDKPDLIRWAQARGSNFPDALARCFANAVTQGH